MHSNIALRDRLAVFKTDDLETYSLIKLIHHSRYREFCGFKAVTHWHQLHGLMSNRSIAAYQRIYDTPEDLELFSAGISEAPVPGGLLGPTFTCIIGRQYHNLRRGDRFWYENGGWPSSFTLDQLKEQLSNMIFTIQHT